MAVLVVLGIAAVFLSAYVVIVKVRGYAIECREAANRADAAADDAERAAAELRDLLDDAIENDPSRQQTDVIPPIRQRTPPEIDPSRLTTTYGQRSRAQGSDGVGRHRLSRPGKEIP